MELIANTYPEKVMLYWFEKQYDACRLDQYYSEFLAERMPGETKEEIYGLMEEGILFDEFRLDWLLSHMEDYVFVNYPFEV